MRRRRSALGLPLATEVRRYPSAATGSRSAPRRRCRPRNASWTRSSARVRSSTRKVGEPDEAQPVRGIQADDVHRGLGHARPPLDGHHAARPAVGRCAGHTLEDARCGQRLPRPTWEPPGRRLWNSPRIPSGGDDQQGQQGLLEHLAGSDPRPDRGEAHLRVHLRGTDVQRQRRRALLGSCGPTRPAPQRRTRSRVSPLADRPERLDVEHGHAGARFNRTRPSSSSRRRYRFVGRP